MSNFINPYNFIPLGRERAKAYEEKGTLTGVIEYSLYTKTPLFIPNTSNNKTFQTGNVLDHKSYDFFSYTDLSDQSKTYEKEYFKPVIPGSEIRGMLRSNYEILTNSCMSVIDNDIILSKRTEETFLPALIKKNKNGTYDLYEAEDCLWRTEGENNNVDELDWKEEYNTRKCYRQKNYPEGCEVSFNKVKREGRCKPLAQMVSRKKGKEGMVGYVIKGEDGPKMNQKGEKHCCHIFQLKGKTPFSKRISLDTLDKVLQEYKKKGEHEYKEYQEELEKFKKSRNEKYFPVYYSKIDRRLMLSPACITREIYQNKLKDMIKSFGSCTEKGNLCPACALFGTLGDHFQVSSRIRFSDLSSNCEENVSACYDKIITLLPLSTPKLNNMEFYLQRPEKAWFWTYDYYIDSNGKTIPYQPQINGRKFYWHQIGVTLPRGVEKNNQNITIRPVKKGIIFTGKLYFQKLTEEELKTLLWLLNTGDNGLLKEKKHGYKLGTAKPLGLGSVAMSVDQVRLREVYVDRKNHTIHMEDNIKYKTFGEEENFDPKVVEYFKIMTSFEAVDGEKVCYPILNGKNRAETKGYEWFVKNHKKYNRKKHKLANMTNKRNEMLFGEYMKAMEPELQRVDLF